MFPLTPSAVSKLDAGEAFNLWGHLTYRYDNIQLTEIFLSMANDGDFKAFLTVGQKMLFKQIKLLEDELRYFSIPGPIRPVGVQAPGDIQFANDDTMFRNAYSGISGALSVHVSAAKRSTTNDRIRNLFVRLLIDEVDTFDKAVKFGKLKGWLNPTPSFGVFVQ